MYDSKVKAMQIEHGKICPQDNHELFPMSLNKILFERNSFFQREFYLMSYLKLYILS